MSYQKKAILGGIGAALVVGLSIGAYWLYQPKPERDEQRGGHHQNLAPWNVSAIVARYDYADTDSHNNFAFYYTLENTTDSDYHLEDDAAVSIFERVERQKPSLMGPEALDYPIVIPPKASMMVAVHFEYSYNGSRKNMGIHERRRDIQKEVLARFGELNGFILFDRVHHYQIDFPGGWHFQFPFVVTQQ